MDFDDGQQPMIWRNREEFTDKNHQEIVAAMIEEAKAAGLEPMDYNYFGVPNIYLRGYYTVDMDAEGKPRPEKTSRWERDGFAMFVQRHKEDGSN